LFHVQQTDTARKTDIFCIYLKNKAKSAEKKPDGTKPFNYCEQNTVNSLFWKFDYTCTCNILYQISSLSEQNSYWIKNKKISVKDFLEQKWIFRHAGFQINAYKLTKYKWLILISSEWEKIPTSKRLLVCGLINLLVEKILLPKHCKWTKKLPLSPGQ